MNVILWLVITVFLSIFSLITLKYNSKTIILILMNLNIIVLDQNVNSFVNSHFFSMQISRRKEFSENKMIFEAMATDLAWITAYFTGLCIMAILAHILAIIPALVVYLTNRSEITSWLSARDLESKSSLWWMLVEGM